MKVATIKIKNKNKESIVRNLEFWFTPRKFGLWVIKEGGAFGERLKQFKGRSSAVGLTYEINYA